MRLSIELSCCKKLLNNFMIVNDKIKDMRFGLTKRFLSFQFPFTFSGRDFPN